MYCFAKLCRLCTNNINIVATLHTTDSDEIQLKDKLLSIMPELVPMDEKLPTHVCATCHERLKDAYDFKKQCLQSLDVLMSYLAQMKNVIIDEAQVQQVAEINIRKYESNFISNIKVESENLTNIPTPIKQDLLASSNEFLPYDCKLNLCNVDENFALTCENKLSLVEELPTAAENAEFIKNEIDIYDNDTESFNNDIFKKFVEQAQQCDAVGNAQGVILSNKFHEEDGINLVGGKTEPTTEQIENDAGPTTETNELPNNMHADETIDEKEDTRKMRRKRASKTTVQYSDDNFFDEHEAMDDFDYNSSGSEFQANSDDCDDSDDDFDTPTANIPNAKYTVPRVEEIANYTTSPVKYLNITPSVTATEVLFNNEMINLKPANEINKATDRILVNANTACQSEHIPMVASNENDIAASVTATNVYSNNEMNSSNHVNEKNNVSPGIFLNSNTIRQPGIIEERNDRTTLKSHENFYLNDENYQRWYSKMNERNKSVFINNEYVNMTTANITSAKYLNPRLEEFQNYTGSLVKHVNNTLSGTTLVDYSNNQMTPSNRVKQTDIVSFGISPNSNPVRQPGIIEVRNDRTTQFTHENFYLNQHNKISENVGKNYQMWYSKLNERNKPVFRNEESEDCDDPDDYVSMTNANITRAKYLNPRLEESQNHTATLVKHFNNTISGTTPADYSNYEMNQLNRTREINNVSSGISPNSNTEGQSLHLFKIPGTNQSAVRDPEDPTKYTLQHPIDPDTKYVFIRNPILQQFLCKTCNVQVRDNCTLMAHMARHVNGKKLACEICNKRVYNMKALREHMSVHRTDRPFACTLCDKNYKDRSSLTGHMRTHNKTLVCEYCSALFPNTCQLKNHVANKHSQEKKFICTICGSAFKILNGLKTHMLKHDKSIKYECDICNRVLGTKKALREHKQNLHTEKKHTCNFCNKKFSTKCILDTHLLHHTGEKPHVCKHCGKAFRTKPVLTNHVRTHTGQRPFVCRVCDRGFTQATGLDVHMRTHTGEKPYKCKECGKCYTQSYVYYQHVKKKHPKEEGSKEADVKEQDEDQSTAS